MFLTHTQRFFVFLSSGLGTLQGVTWAGLSLTSIILHKTYKTEVISSNPKFINVVNSILYRYYIWDSEIPQYKYASIKPHDFFILMCFHFIFNTVWSAVSSLQFFAVYRNKSYAAKVIIAWGIITGIVCLLDLVTSCLLLKNYMKCTDLVCRTAAGIVLSLGARGYTLLPLNWSLVYCQLKTGIQYAVRKKANNAVLDASVIPKPTLQHSAVESTYYSPSVQSEPIDLPGIIRAASMNFGQKTTNNLNPYSRSVPSTSTSINPYSSSIVSDIDRNTVASDFSPFVIAAPTRAPFRSNPMY
ncbi:uncharacterized protein [Diabrotica undecimpunctata]|uniref:uncharacterized protein n=1 Tax=Diabrotica undecimpunctata TaxID=50387 RepID=UPI003B639B1A